MEIVIRNETEKDYRKVEEVTREGFWNHFQPGADEHFLLHNLRKSPDFISELKGDEGTFRLSCLKKQQEVRPIRQNLKSE